MHDILCIYIVLLDCKDQLTIRLLVGAPLDMCYEMKLYNNKTEDMSC